MMKTKLDKLLALIHAASNLNPNSLDMRGLDGDIAEILELVPHWASQRDALGRASWGGGRPGDYWEAPFFTTSTDAAKTLIPEGWTCSNAWFDNDVSVFNLTKYDDSKPRSITNPAYVGGESTFNTATALLIAALRAHVKELENGQ